MKNAFQVLRHSGIKHW